MFRLVKVELLMGTLDLGPAIENGQLVARIKDDHLCLRKDFASMTFALGEKARSRLLKL